MKCSNSKDSDGWIGSLSKTEFTSSCKCPGTPACGSPASLEEVTEFAPPKPTGGPNPIRDLLGENWSQLQRE